jgi:hypothetical protein
MFERVRCRIEKCVKFSDLYRSQKLKYFMTVKKLTEWQMRWSLILSQYNFFILYLLENQNERADALLNMQNVSTDLSDDRVQHCTTQIIHSEMMSKPIQTASMTVADISYLCLYKIRTCSVKSQILNRCSECWRKGSHTMSCVAIQKQWDHFYCFKVRIFITKCFLSNEEKLLFVKDTECCSQNLFVQNWFSIHMTQQWLNTQKKCNWCSFIMTVLLTWDATECLYILSKLWQML